MEVAVVAALVIVEEEVVEVVEWEEMVVIVK